jgi:apolipoprotein N-acyltransferase
MLRSFRKSLPKFTGNLFDLGIALGSGILMGMAFAPVEAWYFAWVALAPLWYLVCRDRLGGTSADAAASPLASRNSHSIIYAFCWGIGFYGLGLNWIWGIHPMTWMGVPYFTSLGIATFCLTFITLWGSSLTILWSISLRFINSKSQLNSFVRVILGTACWCGLEELYSLTDLWWTSLALTQSPHNLPILHLGQLSGPTTVSAAIVLINGLIAEAYLGFNRVGIVSLNENRHYATLTQRWRKASPYINTAIASITSLHLIGFALANQPSVQAIESSLNIGIIQGNIGNEIRHYQSGYDVGIENYTKGYLELALFLIERVKLSAHPSIKQF